MVRYLPTVAPIQRQFNLSLAKTADRGDERITVVNLAHRRLLAVTKPQSTLLRVARWAQIADVVNESAHLSGVVVVVDADCELAITPPFHLKVEGCTTERARIVLERKARLGSTLSQPVVLQPASGASGIGLALRAVSLTPIVRIVVEIERTQRQHTLARPTALASSHISGALRSHVSASTVGLMGVPNTVFDTSV